MAAVSAVGAVVRLDPHPAKRLAAFERAAHETDEPNGVAMLEEYAAGHWALARLHCWAEAEWPDGRNERRDGMVVDKVWVRVGDRDGTIRHAYEMFSNAAPEIHGDLHERGIDIDYDTLLNMEPSIELDRDVEGLVRR